MPQELEPLSFIERQENKFLLAATPVELLMRVPEIIDKANEDKPYIFPAETGVVMLDIPSFTALMNQENFERGAAFVDKYKQQVARMAQGLASSKKREKFFSKVLPARQVGSEIVKGAGDELLFASSLSPLQNFVFCLKMQLIADELLDEEKGEFKDIGATYREKLGLARPLVHFGIDYPQKKSDRLAVKLVDLGEQTELLVMGGVLDASAIKRDYITMPQFVNSKENGPRYLGSFGYTPDETGTLVDIFRTAGFSVAQVAEDDPRMNKVCHRDIVYMDIGIAEGTDLKIALANLVNNDDDLKSFVEILDQASRSIMDYKIPADIKQLAQRMVPRFLSDTTTQKEMSSPPSGEAFYAKIDGADKWAQTIIEFYPDNEEDALNYVAQVDQILSQELLQALNGTNIDFLGTHFTGKNELSITLLRNIPNQSNLDNDQVFNGEELQRLADFMLWLTSDQFSSNLAAKLYEAGASADLCDQLILNTFKLNVGIGSASVEADHLTWLFGGDEKRNIGEPMGLYGSIINAAARLEALLDKVSQDGWDANLISIIDRKLKAEIVEILRNSAQIHTQGAIIMQYDLARRLGLIQTNTVILQHKPKGFEQKQLGTLVIVYPEDILPA